MRKSSADRLAAAIPPALYGGLVVLLAAAWVANAGVRAAAHNPRMGEHLVYASPMEMLFSADSGRLFVLCQGSDEVRVLNAATYAEIRRIPVGHMPRGFSFSHDAGRMFVANSWDDTVSVIDTHSLQVVATWQVRGEPSSAFEDREGKRLFVANRVSNDVAVLNARTGVEEKRLAAGRGASYITPSRDSDRIYVTHVYPNPTRESTENGNRIAPQSEITVIDRSEEHTSELQSP